MVAGRPQKVRSSHGSARPARSPVQNGSPASLTPLPPSLKASGELQEKVPRVYTHMHTTIFGRAGTRLSGETRIIWRRLPPPHACVGTKPPYIHLHSDIVR
ncbi:unnamed protein product [Danaus chrysippus]|uniref:(African queen) hypothetical protein n=1 Tax=Danaus chrysippus TaxID=151541 RepID=A0A8J2MX27_9NEOP|nr:unnamed protein product [Danaus chrysippus]